MRLSGGKKAGKSLGDMDEFTRKVRRAAREAKEIRLRLAAAKKKRAPFLASDNSDKENEDKEDNDDSDEDEDCGKDVTEESSG